jgi:hypothetical protein
MEIKEHRPEAESRDRPGLADATQAARQAVSREIDDARARVGAGMGAVREQAAGAGLSGLVAEQAERRKEDAAEGLRAFASAVRRASDELGERDTSMAARLVQEAAQGLERLSGGLQSRSVTGMARDAADFGRAHPATFLAGCLIAGVAAGRLLGAARDEGRAGEDHLGPDRRYGERAGGGDEIEPAAAGAASDDLATGGAVADAQGGAGGGMAGAGRLAGSESGLAGQRGGMAGAAAGGSGGFGANVGEGAGMAPARPDVTRQAGVFGGPVAPASGMGAPGEDDDPLATREERDAEERRRDALEIDAPFASDERREGGRDGER